MSTLSYPHTCSGNVRPNRLAAAMQVNTCGVCPKRACQTLVYFISHRRERERVGGCQPSAVFFCIVYSHISFFSLLNWSFICLEILSYLSVLQTELSPWFVIRQENARRSKICNHDRYNYVQNIVVTRYVPYLSRFPLYHPRHGRVRDPFFISRERGRVCILLLF